MQREVLNRIDALIPDKIKLLHPWVFSSGWQ